VARVSWSPGWTTSGNPWLEGGCEREEDGSQDSELSSAVMRVHDEIQFAYTTEVIPWEVTGCVLEWSYGAEVAVRGYRELTGR